MNNLSSVIFLLPLIALILVAICYLLLLNKTTNKVVFKRFVLIAIMVAFVLNFAWELGQMPLYKDTSYDIQHIAFCGLASLADTIMVLLIYFFLALIYKDSLWIKHLNLKQTSIIVLIGGIGAVAAEIRHLSQGNWAYDISMPIILFVNVGLSPVLQFMLLPILSYFLSFYFLEKKYSLQTN